MGDRNAMRLHALLVSLAAIFLLATSPLAAQTGDSSIGDVPAELKSWVPWVTKRHPEWNCARVPQKARTSGDSTQVVLPRVCVWLGSSRFVIGEHKTDFLLQGELLQDDEVELPSGMGFRPGNLRIVKDGVPTEKYTITENGKTLSLSLNKGTYLISGELLYDALPNRIPVPANYGIVDISIDFPKTGQAAPTAYRDHDSIRISQQTQEVGSDSVEGRIWRMVTDRSPLAIKTKIELQVSGSPRTINLGHILPKNSVLISSESAAPLSFSETGDLSIQIFQGQHQIELQSVIGQPVSEIVLEETSSEYLPDEEIWVWEGNPELRTVEVDNVRTLNAAQVELPAGWSAPSVFAVSREATVTLKTLRRGQETAQKNELNLQRSIWPVINGSGLTVEDSFNGVMNSGFRLNALPELKLGSASVSGLPVPVTVDAKTNLLGIELRSQSVTLRALSQIAVPRLFSATISGGGWDTELENIKYNIAIPPSWKLVHMSDVTTQGGTWTSYWSIFDIFILLILAVFSYKIFGARISILFTVIVVIGKGEFMLPATFYGWTLFFAACSLLLSEKSYTILRVGCGTGLAASLAVFLMQSLAFAKLQLMQAIHPQLQAGTRFRTITQEIFSLFAASPFLWPIFLFGFIAVVLAFLWVLKGKFILQKFGRLIVVGIGLMVLSSLLAGVASVFDGITPRQQVEYQTAGSFAGGAEPAPMEESLDQSVSSDAMMLEKAPQSRHGRVRKAISKAFVVTQSDRELQSGPSLPSWRWRSAFATVAGPVPVDHSITLYFIPSSIERIFCVVRLGVILFLAYSLLITIARSFNSTLKALVPTPNVAAMVVALMLCGLQQNAHADIPHDSLLTELEERLEEQQCSDSSCASIDSIALGLDNGSFSLEIQARSRGVSAIVIPGPVGDLIPVRVTVDGKESVASRIVDRFLQVKLSDGSHLISVRGLVEPSSSLAVTIPEKPLRFSWRSSSWKVSPPVAPGDVPDEVRFMRESAGEKTGESGDVKKGAAPTRDVFRVTRNILIDERVTIEGQVSRLGDITKATTAHIPLLQGESSSSSSWPVENGKLILSFSPGQSTASFSSSITPSSEFVLSASTDDTVFDEWSVRCKDYVQCESDGIAPSKRIIDGVHALLFAPFKGEKLTVRSKLLESAKGEHMTIENVQHTNSWGETALKGTVGLSVRATKQAPLVLSFSDSALTIDLASIDSVADSRKFQPESVSLLVEPGTHQVVVEYSKPFVPAFKETVPELKINYRVGNITTTVEPTPSRWIIWLGGGNWGPAVVFWSKLLVIVIILVALKTVGGIALSWFATLVLSVAVSFLPTIWQPIPVLWVIYLHSASVRAMIAKYSNHRIVQTLVSAVAVFSVALFYLIVRVGLLSEPPSLITGNGSSAFSLRWFVDFATFTDSASMPTPWVLSLPMTYWRTITLILSVALVFLGLRWVRETVALLRDESPQGK